MRIGRLGITFSTLLLAVGTERTPPAQGIEFVHSNTCATCHDNSDRARAMRDKKGRPVAPFDLWRSSMMANAARDPFWRAMISAEVKATPSRKAAIEAKCMRCHAPMATQGTPDEAKIAILDDRAHARHDLALDSVSCSVCHQVSPKNLGQPASFTGRFVINTEQHAYGPHRGAFAMPMIRHSGLRPVEGRHILESRLCGSCHTLDTHTLTVDGKATGSVLPEQSPYLEWRNSIYSTEVDKPRRSARNCQDCHVPTTDVDGQRIASRIAHNPGGRDFPFLDSRTPFGRHVFVGGNALIPAILRDNKKELEVDATAAEFNATIAAVKQQLRRRTARVRIKDVTQKDAELSFGVQIENRAGHKFPSAYPSRRAWLHVTVKDASGRTVFESGRSDDAGRILDGQGKPLPAEGTGTAILPHHKIVRRADQVPVFEAIMADEDGKATWRLLRGASYLKDNRILPKGWRKDGPHAAETKPAGIGDDAGFRDGAATVAYRIPTAAAKRPLTIEVDLVYQTLGARFAAELFAVDTPEVRRFERMYLKADRRPLLVDRTVAKSR